MPEITVARRFNLNLSHNDLPMTFEPGTHTISDEIAEHWFVKANTAPPDPAQAEILASAAALEREAHGRSVADAALLVAKGEHAAQMAARTAEAVEMITATNDRADAANARADAAEAELAAGAVDKP